MRSGEELTYNNWATKNLLDKNGYDFIYMRFFEASDLGKLYSETMTDSNYVVCEVDISI
jgi:hypothetical protein